MLRASGYAFTSSLRRHLLFRFQLQIDEGTDRKDSTLVQRAWIYGRRDTNKAYMASRGASGAPLFSSSALCHCFTCCTETAATALQPRPNLPGLALKGLGERITLPKSHSKRNDSLKGDTGIWSG